MVCRKDSTKFSVCMWKGLKRGWRDQLDKRLDEVWDGRNKKIITGKLDRFKNTPVTCAFLHHLDDPIEYPILDTNVFKAMRELDACYNKKTNRNICNWDKDYADGYKEFFQKAYKKHKSEIQSLELPSLKNIGREIIRRRVLDRALWEFGRTLNNQLDCQLSFIDSRLRGNDKGDNVIDLPGCRGRRDILSSGLWCNFQSV
jgi:hypothetical protein